MTSQQTNNANMNPCTFGTMRMFEATHLKFTKVAQAMDDGNAIAVQV